MATSDKDETQFNAKQGRARSGARWLRTAGLAATGGTVLASTLMTVGPQLAAAPNAIAAPDTTKPTATVSGVANPTKLLLYEQSLGPAYNNMQTALQNIDASIKDKDWNAARAACADLGDSGRQFKALLPSPDSRVTPKIRTVADEITTASSMCTDWGPSTTYDEYRATMRHAQNALDQLRDVKGLVSPTS